MDKNKVYGVISFVSFAGLVAMWVLIGVWAYQYSQIPAILDLEPVTVYYAATGTPQVPAAPLIEVK